MAYYPVFLDMTGRPALVIGGGPVAERKVEGLLVVGGSVTVISPTLTAKLEAWAKEGRIRHVARNYGHGGPGWPRLAFSGG